jgi:hypothetical protein
MANALKKALNAVLGGVNSAKEIRSLNDLAEFSKGADDLLQIKDKSYTEIIRESVGINIPLPSQEEAFEFYQKFEGKFERITVEEQQNDGSIIKVQKREYRIKENPTSPLAYLDPKEWTNKQYLKYQSDYQKFKVADPYNKLSQKSFESKAKAIKRIKKEIYDEKKRFNVLLELYEDFQSEKAENLKKDVPQDLRAKGIQSFPELINALLKVTVKTFFTSLAATYKQFGLDIADQKEAELKEKLGINDLSQASPEEIKAKFCPVDIEPLIQKRDNMVNSLNKTQERLNNLKKPIEGSGVVLDVAQKTSTRIAVITFITNQAIKILPLSPGPLVSILNDLNTIRETILFTNEGQARLPKFKGAINNVNIPLNQFSRLITQIVFQLSELDELIALCAPDRVSELTSLSPEVLATVAIQLSSDLETNNASTYKGFRLEIETKKYTDTVNQNRAVGKNSSGIVLISTPFSFASDPNVLIRELQFRIDSENLEAY